MGRSIRIYLPQETVSGMRHAEIANWTGQALACPRSMFSHLRNWPEVQRPGVYVLFGANEETAEDIAYIGEAEVVIDRLASHVASKDFWTEAVAFTSKDDNLTKAHVKFLESRLVSMAREAGRYRLQNTAGPTLPTLPRGDRDAMEEFLSSVRTLLGVLGHRLLEPLVRPDQRTAAASIPVDNAARSSAAAVPQTSSPAGAEQLFFLRVGDVEAQGIWTDEGMVVLETSTAGRITHSSLTRGAASSREALIANGALAERGSGYVFTRDAAFKSPSQAASVVVGYSINGRETWKTREGRTFNQVYAAAVLD